MLFKSDSVVPILWEYFMLLIITYLLASLLALDITWVADIKITIKSNGRNKRNYVSTNSSDPDIFIFFFCLDLDYKG